jgi:hypothetical protein
VITVKSALGAFRFVTLVLITGPALRAGAAIDFTPITGERVLEGVVFKQLIFHENGRAITYEQPRGWTYSGDTNHIRFTLPDIGQAQAEMAQSPLLEPQTLTGAAVKLLQSQVLASVPPGSQGATVISEEQNPITINRQQTYAVIVGYTLSGQEYRLSVIFLNLPSTRVQFRVIARKQDFEKVDRLFRASLFSLQWH